MLCCINSLVAFKIIDCSFSFLIYLDESIDIVYFTSFIIAKSKQNYENHFH